MCKASASEREASEQEPGWDKRQPGGKRLDLESKGAGVVADLIREIM